MSWMNEIFGVEKPVIAMCHLKPIPPGSGLGPHGGDAVRRYKRAPTCVLSKMAGSTPLCSPTKPACFI